MRRMAVVAVEIVDVIAVADCFMAAFARVLMIVALVDHVDVRRTLVPVAIVLVVSMAVVEIVGVVMVADRNVITARAMDMLMCLMRLVFDIDHLSILLGVLSVRSLAACEGRSIVS